MSRALWRELHHKSVKGRADGNYYHVLFNTAFEQKSSASFEHVLLEYEDGQWRVALYALR